MNKQQLKGIDSDLIITKYQELNNVWKVGEYFNISGQSVHKFLTDIGKINKMNYWTNEENEYLKANYLNYRNDCNLKELALNMNRTTAFLSRKAKLLGLTDNVNHVSMKKFADNISVSMKKYIEENGHPKGMKGKFHTDKTKNTISKSSKKMWEDKSSYVNSEQYKQICSDRMSKNQANGILNKNYSRTKNGVVQIGNKTHFYRSEWEVNIAAYLEFLKNKKEILEWEYEPKTFWFYNILRGVRSYKPDFRITNNDNTQYFIEVKGWMDNKSKTKLSRMKKYYPEIEIQLIEQKRYNEISKMKSIIPHWGDLSNGNKVEELKCTVSDCDNKLHSKGLCRKHFYKVYKK